MDETLGYHRLSQDFKLEYKRLFSRQATRCFLTRLCRFNSFRNQTPRREVTPSPSPSLVTAESVRDT